MRGSTVAGMEVYISSSHNFPNEHKDLVSDPKWTVIRQSFEKVDLLRMAGKNFTHKLELLMAVYSKPSA